MKSDPVVLINAFEVPEGEDEAFLEGWERGREFLSTQPGYLSTKLHRSVTPDADFRFVNVALWDSAQTFREATSHPKFRELAFPYRFHASLYAVAREDKQPPAPGRVEPLKVPPGSNVFNAVVSWLSRLGIPLGPNTLLSVRGRKSGIARTTPIAILEIGDRRFVQSPYGEVQWTRNLRAAGEATLTTGGRAERVSAARLSQAEAATFYRETLPPYLNRSFFTRFFVGRNLGMAATAKDPEGAAATHPVFELHHLE